MKDCLPVFPVGVSGKTIRVDNSALEAMQRCPRYAWHLLCLRRTIAGSRPALDFGGAVHAGVAAHLLGQTPEVQAREIEKCFEGVELDEEEYRHAARAREVVGLYRKHYADDGLKMLALPGENLPLVERSFSLPFGHEVVLGGERLAIEYQGRIDAAVDTGRHVMVLDHKTTSRFGEDANTYWDGFVNSGQMKGYCWALQQLLKRPVNGALINLIVVRPPLKTDRGNAKPRTEFHRREFYYTQDVIQEWKGNVVAIVQNFLRYCELHYFPMHTFACTLYKRCQYLDVCSCGSEDQRMALLGSGAYKEYTWTPHGERKEGE